MTTRAQRIEDALADALELKHLEVADESGGHNVPAGAESHFKVVLVAEAFEGRSRIDRHRTVQQILQSEFDGGMHALAIHPYTADEWQARHGAAPMSPPCAGGDGGERTRSGG